MYVVIATSHTRYINDTYVLGQVVLLLQQIHPIGMSGAVWKNEHCRAPIKVNRRLRRMLHPTVLYVQPCV